MDGNPKRNSPGYDPPEALTPEEIQELRVILKNRDRQKWLLSTTRLWLGYLSACIIAMYAIWDNAARLFTKH